jgi:amino acid adenylation domain-containing protein
MRYEQYRADSARRRGDHPALVCAGQRLDYRWLHQAAGCFARALVGRAGIGDGERCVLFLDNRPEVAVGVFGTLAAGAVFSVVNPATKADKLGYVLADCQASVLVTQASLLPAARAAAAGVPSIRCIVVVDADGPLQPRELAWPAFLDGAGAGWPALAGIDLDLAMLVYTSGSTGRPKGVMMTHRNLVHAAGSIGQYLRSSADDVVLSVLPLAFDYGLYQLLMTVRLGATLVLEKSFAFPNKVLPLLASERVTGLPLVPTMAAMILGLRRFDPAWAASVRYLTNTAAALPPAHIARLRALFPHARLYSMYGVTESKRCTWLPPEQLDHRPDSVGIAIPDTQAWVADAEGRPAPPGTVGELVVRGGHVMQGYWNDPEASARVLRPGRYPWERVLHTGDLFRMDAEGYFYFVARKDDIIKSRGEKVSPTEVENVLYALAGIREAAVVGVPDPVQGMALKAIVALAPGTGLDARAIVGHCVAHLEDVMVPRLVEIRDELPKTATGKIRRAALQAEAEGRPPPP